MAVSGWIDWVEVDDFMLPHWNYVYTNKSII